MSEWVLTNQPCPVPWCGSSDAVSYNDKGWGKCFSCDTNIPPPDDMEEDDTYESSRATPTEKGNTEVMEEFAFIPDRGITAETYEFFECYTKLTDGEPFERAYRYGDTAMKIRVLPKKGFRSTGKINEAGLYGQDKFKAGGTESLMIVEGEEDVHASHQMLPNVSVVGLPSSSSSVKTVRSQYEYINSFDKIYFCLDNDKPGQKHLVELTQMFDFKKVYIVNMGKYNDPNEFLLAKDSKFFRECFERARRYSPKAVKHLFSELTESLTERGLEKIGTYPFKGLQEALYGLYRGHTVVFKGLEGIGKTETFRAMQNHLPKENKEAILKGEFKIGVIYLEETTADTVKAVATYAQGHPYVHPEDSSSSEEIIKAFKTVVPNEDTLYMYSDFDLDEVDSFLATIRFMVAGAGCDIIFLDHISWLAEGVESGKTERIAMLAQKLTALALELNFCLAMISHVNDDGKALHSRNVTKAASTVIHMERDRVATFEKERNLMKYTIEKARKGGQSGPAGFAMFKGETMTLEDYTDGE